MSFIQVDQYTIIKKLESRNHKIFGRKCLLISLGITRGSLYSEITKLCYSTVLSNRDSFLSLELPTTSFLCCCLSSSSTSHSTIYISKDFHTDTHKHHLCSFKFKSIARHFFSDSANEQMDGWELMLFLRVQLRQ